MGYLLNRDGINTLFREWESTYSIFAPTQFGDGGRFSDTDCIRYSQVHSIEDIVFDRKSEYSFKEVLLPIAQTLFYFTEDSVKESDAPKKGAIVFLRSCDLHAVKRLDDMYLRNGAEDYYYKRLRQNTKFILIGCKNAFDHCFCVDMGTNKSEDYHLSIEPSGDEYLVDCNEDEWDQLLSDNAVSKLTVTPSFVTETKTKVNIPANLDHRIASSSIWNEYDSRCINCGRCNFVCPTCTCFSMQDLFYSENGKVGERRRVWASCMVDGYTDVAGGGNYRKKNGQRMRYKVLHKVLDFKQRNGYHMCVGCGRCDDVCPEYISFSHCINKLEQGMEEVNENDAK